MPKAEHDELVRRANELGLTGKRRDAYVYGTLHKIKKARKAKRARRRHKLKRLRKKKP